MLSASTPNIENVVKDIKKYYQVNLPMKRVITR